MIHRKLPRGRKHYLIPAVFTADITLCLTILILLFIALHQSYQGWIYRYKIVEVTSLISSLIGFYLAAGLLLVKKFFGASFPRGMKPQKICIRGGLFHLACAMALFFYFASSYGHLMIVLGHIYRNYGYVQLINAIFLFAMFVYFVGSAKLA